MSYGILEVAERLNIELIVIGTAGAHGTLDRWLGTISSIVAQKTGCPTLLVPEGTKPAPIKRLLYTCDFSTPYFDRDTEGRVANLAKQLRASVAVLFVKQDDEDYSATEKMMRKHFKTDAPNVPLSIKVVENPLTEKAIKIYAAQNDIDWIIVTAEKYGFLNTIVHNILAPSCCCQTVE